MEIGKYYKSSTGLEGRYTGEGFLVWQEVSNSKGNLSPKALAFVDAAEFEPVEEILFGNQQEIIPL